MVAEVTVSASAKAAYVSSLDIGSLYWDWPVTIGFDGSQVFYTRPGDHWVEGRSSTSQSRMVFVFHGDRIRIELPKGQDRGFVRIFIDGDFEDELNLFGISGDVVHEILELEPGRHEVKLMPTGQAVPASEGQAVQVGQFRFRMAMVVDDKGEESNELAWSAMMSGA